MMFVVKGEFRIGDSYQPFSISVDAVNERVAREKALSLIGSNHKCKRRFIKVSEVNAVSE